MVPLGMILIIVGVSMIIKPSLFWLLLESWKSIEETEPSEVFIISTRYGGMMMTLIGIGTVIVPFLKPYY